MHEDIEKYARSVIDKENSYDSSMEGYLLNELVQNYSEMKVKDIDQMFNDILKRQKEQKSSYGDMDFTVCKIDVVEPRPLKFNPQKDSTITYDGLKVNCNCGDETFVIIRRTMETPPIKEELVLIYDTYDETEVTEVKHHSFVQYADERDRGFILGYEMMAFDDNKIMRGQLKGGDIKRHSKLMTVIRDLRNITKRLNQQ